jgi:DNA-binding MarR family transcriptional regulator
MRHDARKPLSQQLIGDLAAQADFFEREGLSRPSAEALVQIDMLMQRVRRNAGRRETLGTLLKSVRPEMDMAQLDVISAIMAGRRWPEVEITVGFVAEKMQVDPSRASRLVAELVEAGLLRRVASQTDSRRIVLEMTAEGEAFAAQFHELKWQLMAEGMKTWSEADLVTFARLLERFSNWASEVRKQQTDESEPGKAK